MSKQVIHSFIESVIRDITTFGGFPFFGAVILFLLLLGQQNATVFQLVVGIIFIMAIAILIRSIYFKSRPKSLPYNNWLEKIEASSFPSIHATRVWFLAFVFGNYFQNIAIWALLAISAVAVCYSRLHMKRHDLWDLVGGTVLGIVTFKIVEFIQLFLEVWAGIP
ncbi:hypothetical protein CL619_04625 [archaeon]|nr:hypothetical protein [archaeon]|tara:strand:- start:43 stop:537 length:495 start_codon:yes stop_codon:yes gene_type:complete